MAQWHRPTLLPSCALLRKSPSHPSPNNSSSSRMLAFRPLLPPPPGKFTSDALHSRGLVLPSPHRKILIPGPRRSMRPFILPFWDCTCFRPIADLARPRPISPASRALSNYTTRTLPLPPALRRPPPRRDLPRRLLLPAQLTPWAPRHLPAPTLRPNRLAPTPPPSRCSRPRRLPINISARA
jgi:hypothetical protein